MSNRGAIIRFCASALIVALFLTYTSIKGLSYTTGDVVIQTMSPIIVVDTTPQNDSNAENANTDISSPQTPLSPTATDTTKSVMVSASGAVQGKVIEKFISPYTANTSYNNVYLKNNTDLNINLKDFVNGKLGFKIEKNSKPQVLILHTHATESYLRHNENGS